MSVSTNLGITLAANKLSDMIGVKITGTEVKLVASKLFAGDDRALINFLETKLDSKHEAVEMAKKVNELIDDYRPLLVEFIADLSEKSTADVEHDKSQNLTVGSTIVINGEERKIVRIRKSNNH